MTSYSSTELRRTHDTSAFDCGKPQLNEWLQRNALRAQQQDTARTYVWTKPDDDVVLAYYSIAPTQVTAADVPSRAAGGNSVIPSFLLGRLAVDHVLQGRGLGVQLLLDALERILTAAATAAGRLVIVDPIDDDAASFYANFGFRDCRTDQRRMYMKIASIEAIMNP